MSYLPGNRVLLWINSKAKTTKKYFETRALFIENLSFLFRMFKTHVVDSKWNAWIVASKIRRQKKLRNFVLKILDLKTKYSIEK